MRYLWLASVLSLFQLTLAGNTIIDDDEAGDSSTGTKIVYQPASAWGLNTIPECPDCSGPNSQTAYNNTWHGSLFNGQNKIGNGNTRTATVSFFGSSVSVICILSNSLTNPTGNSDMTFTIDGVEAPPFSHKATGSSGFQTNVTVFTSQTLSLADHTLIIHNGLAGGGPSLVILDSIVYSSDDVSSPTSISASSIPTAATSSAVNSGSAEATKSLKSSNNVAPIVGGVIAVLAILLLLGLALLYLRHRRNQHRSNVPLTTSIFAPIERIGSLWSTHSNPAPDMAPVPFTSPVQHLSVSPSPRASPAVLAPPVPPPATRRSRMSIISFNPNLLVDRFRRRPPPLPLPVHQPPAMGAAGLGVPASPALRSGNPLLREPSAQPEPHNIVTSIQAWQQRTLEETANQPPIHPLDISEVDLSSHYDESSTGGDPPPAPPPLPRSPQPPPRRFTVMNN